MLSLRGSEQGERKKEERRGGWMKGVEKQKVEGTKDEKNKK